MDNECVLKAAVEIDRVVLESRLHDLAIVAQTDRSERVATIATVLSKLRPGGYLIGCGPYTSGIIPLTIDQIVLGRPPSPLEKLPDTVADYTLNDAVWLVPREASRIHASILRQEKDGELMYWVKNENSRLGTYANGKRIDTDEPFRLSTGDVLCMGPSGVNSYIFFFSYRTPNNTIGP